MYFILKLVISALFFFLFLVAFEYSSVIIVNAKCDFQIEYIKLFYIFYIIMHTIINTLIFIINTKTHFAFTNDVNACE